jgi:hypothetical protein
VPFVADDRAPYIKESLWFPSEDRGGCDYSKSSGLSLFVEKEGVRALSVFGMAGDSSVINRQVDRHVKRISDGRLWLDRNNSASTKVKGARR